MKHIALLILLLFATNLQAASWKTTETEDSSVAGTEIVFIENENGTGNNWMFLSTIKSYVLEGAITINFDAATMVTSGTNPVTAGVKPGVYPLKIYSGTATLGTVSIANNACATGVVVSPAATGVATTDVPSIGYQTDPIGTTGHDFTTGAVLSIIPRVTANTITVYACNYTGTAVVPELMVVNVRVDR